MMLRNCNDDGLAKILPNKIVKFIDFEWENGKTTIVWTDGSKTTFTACEREERDPWSKATILRKYYWIDIEHEEKK